MNYRFIKKYLVKAVVDKIKSINPALISSKVKFPKVELHSWIESPCIDKENGVREISFIVETYGNNSWEQVQDIANQVTETIINEPLVVEQCEVISVIPEDNEDITEVDESNIIIYRQLNRLVITIKQL